MRQGAPKRGKRKKKLEKNSGEVVRKTQEVPEVGSEAGEKSLSEGREEKCSP